MSRRKVFISYSMAEADWAKRFAEALSKHGVGAWLADFEVKAGEPIQEAIEKGLRESDFVVALISPGTLKSPALFFELGAAIGMGKRVVAIVPKDIEPSDLPVSFRTRRFLIKDSPEATANELVAAEARPEG
jgi:nucleoside 2-deoxyribosyltransferase